MFESFLNAFPLLFGGGSFLNILFVISLGLLIGLFVGALPGLTTLMAMAIVLPISFFMDPLVGIPFLIGVYKGGIFGGSIPAILVSLPGTGASVATTGGLTGSRIKFTATAANTYMVEGVLVGSGTIATPFSN